MSDENRLLISDESLSKLVLALKISGESISESQMVEQLIDNYAISVLQKSIFANRVNQVEGSETFLPEQSSKVVSRIEKWANSPKQINHQILKVFFKKQVDGIAKKSDMKSELSALNPKLTSWSFDSNLSSMATEKGNSHGKAFELDGEYVRLADNVKDIIEEYRDEFMKK